MVNHVLMIAYHYPPVRVSSGLQRTLAFSKYVREHGWKPILLTAHPRAYEQVSDDQMKDIPPDIIISRSFALDTSRHLAIGGRYLKVMALPDRWVSWWFGGVVSGLRHIWKYRPTVIWSTYPIATAHLIALTLSKLTGVPWIADFRDSMTEPEYPREGLKRRVYRWIEKKTVMTCDKAVFTTPGAVRMYKKRYPDLPDEKWEVLANGYNEEIFTDVESSLAPERTVEQPVTLIHSGVIYPSERDPKPFFNALSKLKNDHIIDSKKLKIILRATGYEELYRPMLQQLDIEDIVSLEVGIPYRDALKEMLLADGLLLLQASNCNHQIPAKIYEYFRARRPVFALTDSVGDTAATLVEAGLNNIVPLDDEEAIVKGLPLFIEQIKSGTASCANEQSVKKYSRQASAATLVEWFIACSEQY